MKLLYTVFAFLLVQPICFVYSMDRVHREIPASTSNAELSLEDEYHHKHLYQDLIWYLEEAGRYDEAEREKKKLSRILEEEPEASNIAGSNWLQEWASSPTHQAEMQKESEYLQQLKSTDSEQAEIYTKGMKEKIFTLFKTAMPGFATSFDLAWEANRMGFRPNMWLFQFKDGVKAILKVPTTQAGLNHEIAAYKIDQLFSFSFVPMNIRRTINGHEGALQYFIPNAKDFVTDDVSEQMDPRIFSKMKIFDYLVAHGDRSPRQRNYVMTQNNFLVGIDHEAILNPDAMAGSDFSREIEADPLKYAISPVITQRLREVSDEEVRNYLKDYATTEEISFLIARRGQFLKSLDKAQGLL